MMYSFTFIFIISHRIHFCHIHTLIIIHPFSVRGHSCMPPGRGFGSVEIILRCSETILLYSQYFMIFNDVG